jgi:hypothetical protein
VDNDVDEGGYVDGDDDDDDYGDDDGGDDDGVERRKREIENTRELKLGMMIMTMTTFDEDK